MSEVNYLLLFKGNSERCGPVASVRCFTRFDAAQRAMVKSYEETAIAMNIPAMVQKFDDRYTVRMEDSIRLARCSDIFRWEIIRAVPEDSAPNNGS